MPDDSSTVLSDTENLVATRDRERIAAMFDRISGRYDLLNRVMTAGQDGRWRHLAVLAARPRLGDRALDVATGTGDTAMSLAGAVGPTGRVVGIDVSSAMLRLAEEKAAGLPVEFRRADILQLDIHQQFDIGTVSFGLRNFSDRELAIERMTAALKPGGRLVVLELTPSNSRLAPLIGFYERRVIPVLGRLLGGESSAYTYLPESVARSLRLEQIEDLFLGAGLRDIHSRRLNFGTVALVSGVKAVCGEGEASRR